MICPRCAEPSDSPEARFCRHCGGALPRPEPTAAAAGPRCPIHPDQPAADLCARCGTFTCHQCLRLSDQGKPLCARCFEFEQPQYWPVPWESRAQLGRLSAFGRTLTESAFNPGQRLKRMKPTSGSWWDPLSYLLFAHLPLTVGAVMMAFFLSALVASFAGAQWNPNSGFNLRGIVSAFGIGSVVLFGLGVPTYALTRTFLFAGLEHLALWLMGQRREPFEATVRAHCYASGPAVLSLVPGCGFYAAELAWLVLRVFGLMGVHRTSAALATTAVLAPAMVCLGIPISLAMLGMFRT